MRGTRIAAALFCVAAVLTLLPLCGAESEMIVPEEGVIDEFIQEAPGFSEVTKGLATYVHGLRGHVSAAIFSHT